jgi:GT2 family glycosyltransferase
MCHRGQLLDLDYRVCDGPHRGCGRCLGAAGSGDALYSGASAIRRLANRLPVVPANFLSSAMRSVAQSIAPSGLSEEASRRRMTHMRRVCGLVTSFVAPSQAIRDRFVDFGIAAQRISVADNGIDLSAFAAPVYRSRPRPLRVAFVGTMMASKAPHVLVDALERLPRGAAEAVLIGPYAAYHGDDSYRERLESFAGNPDVRLVGALDHGAIPAALRDVDAIVVPSIWPENSPVIIHEAFAAGIPVVASRIGGIPELVEHGRNGLLFEPGDSDGLAQMLERLIDEPGLLDSLRRGTRRVRTLEEDVHSSRQLYAEVALRRSERIAAVVLNYRTPDQTLLTVRSLRASRRPFAMILVIDNEPQGPDLETTLTAMPEVVYVASRRNLGFAGGVNAGIREALARMATHVLLVNSDAVVPPDTLDALMDALLGTPAAGIAGPVVVSRREPDRIFSVGMHYNPHSGRMRHAAAGHPLDKLKSPPIVPVDGTSGCAALIRREVFETAGLFDERYFFSFEDLEFCLRASRHGWRTVVTTRGLVYHESGRSLGARSPRRLYFAARNHLLLASEWGRGRLRTAVRLGSVVALNAAHAIIAPGGTLRHRLTAVARGTRDYLVGSFGADPEAHNTPAEVNSTAIRLASEAVATDAPPAIRASRPTESPRPQSAVRSGAAAATQSPRTPGTPQTR